MDRSEFVSKLNMLSTMATQSEDSHVRASGAILEVLRASLVAGDEHNEAFIDKVAIMAASQRRTFPVTRGYQPHRHRAAS